MRTKRRALFWDFDGTLAFSPRLWTKTFLRAAESASLPLAVTEEAVRPLLAVGFPWHGGEYERADPLRGEDWWRFLLAKLTRDFLALGCDAARAPALAALTRRYATDPSVYALYDDALPTLTLLSGRGYEHYLLSNHYPELPAVLDSLGLAPFFRAVVVSGLFGYDKPRPEIFEEARRAAGFPEECFMIGDNPEADVEGGLAAGMTAVLVRGDRPSRADLTAKTLAELHPLLP